MIYLVGTNHELQHTAKPKRAEIGRVKEARSKFKVYLKELALKFKATLLAEEFAEEVLGYLDASSNIKSIADELGIEHRFCEPDSTTRTKLGVPATGTGDLPAHERLRLHAIREKYWLETIKDKANDIIIFICGSNHVKSFESLLQKNGFNVIILESYWGNEIYET